ncbi:hypothetical protein VHUM_02403 [Vanrija humicola]|uniref:SUZ domain-containing protein n=1 Tax=Vanrija humicola TaxID=5417 RepID=A0A7D8V119_VANHU|nr:hypothetical protein VHUM_02403 [Vanrija humicola]
MPLQTPFSALALDGAVSVPPPSGTVLADEPDAEHSDDSEGDARSPSPALTVSNGPTSPPSVIDSLAPSNSAMTSPNPTTISTTSIPPGLPMLGVPAVAVPKAELGFGSLHAEDEIKKALSAKDRLFVLMLGKEFEVFIGRVARGEITSRVPTSQASASTSLMDSLGPSKRIDVTAISKYQRMLTYKLAEWYGLRVVPGVEGSMVVGVLGALEDKSLTLKIAGLVPEATAPQTQFRIMQRATPSAGETENSSRATSVSGEDNGTESSGPRGKTLEERTLAYALARKRIIGEGLDDDAVSSTSASFPRSRQHSRFGDDEDDMDMMPRRAYPPDMEYVYPTLYPTGDNQGNPGIPHGMPIPQTAPYGYAPLQGGPYQGYMAQGMGYPPNDGRVYMPPPYPNMPQQAYGAQVQMGGYPQGWQQPQMQPGPPNMMVGAQGPGMMMPPPVGQGWYPPDMGMPPQHPSNMMPMIPQGMPYAPSYPHPQPHPGPTLVQPTPMRHDRHPHSSTSSSISSRSYQDMNSNMNSRPHSRGSTTSTRSAASSVRLGAMYPVGGQAPVYGYRQKAVKVASSSATIGPSAGVAEPRRNGRQSPASTTSSSRSSRRASSIQITQPLPGQHPLPQRPDWAANNVPYHPSPLPPPGHSGHSDASTSDFPPLHRGLVANNAAEPMQVEKVKMRPPPAASAWNNGTARQPHPHPHHQVLPEPTPQPQSPLTPQAAPTISLFSNPISPKAATPVAPHVVDVEADPDFPRRIPSARTPALYDPSAPSAPARAARASPAPVQVPTPLAAEVVTDEVIEARIAALNIKGVSIGPPSTRQPPSYAKIVRRD